MGSKVHNEFSDTVRQLKDMQGDNIEDIYSIDSSEIDGDTDQNVLAVSTNIVLNSKPELNEICKIVDNTQDRRFGLLFESDPNDTFVLIFEPESTYPKTVYQMYAMIYDSVAGVVGEVRKDEISDTMTLEEVASKICDNVPEDVSVDEVKQKMHLRDIENSDSTSSPNYRDSAFEW